MAKTIQPDMEVPIVGNLKPPPPIPDGDSIVEDLGGVVNWMTRVSHTERRVDLKVAELTMPQGEWELLGADPNPVEPPDPVPGGDDIGTRGGGPSDIETK